MSNAGSALPGAAPLFSPIAQGRAGLQGLVLGSTTLVFKYHLVRSTLSFKIKGHAD